MEPQLLKVTLPWKYSFASNIYSHSSFPGIWHFHDEFELTHIIKSEGTRFVGNSVEPFYRGDLVFLGKNLPHTWRNHNEYKDNPTIDAAVAHVIHFHEHFLGDQFFNAPELAQIKTLLDNSTRGLKIHGATRQLILALMNELHSSEGMKRLMLMLEILTTLSQSDEVTLLASELYLGNTQGEDCNRFNNVYQYIINNFKEDVKLDDVAGIAHMTPTSFSRYFKNRMRKSFSEFMIDLKIGYACKLLMQNDEMSVSQICYECGFRNISNFNKHFKRTVQRTPKAYRNQFLIKMR